MEKIGRRPFWIIGVLTLMMTFGEVFGVNVCQNGAMYGYKSHQKSLITKQNDNSSYLSGIVWYSEQYGRFTCCGVIKAIDVQVSNTGAIEFQVWNLTEPVTKTATFLFYNRIYVDIGEDDIRHTTLRYIIPFDYQMPVRDGNAIGWIADESDIIKWATVRDFPQETDSDYLFEDFSEWSAPFQGHPPSFSTLLNQHTFSNNGLEGRIFGVAAVVHPGYTAKIDNLPSTKMIYTSEINIDKVVFNFSVSGITPLERSVYLTVDVQINPDNGIMAWNNANKQVTIEGDPRSAAIGKAYEVTFTVRDGCHSDQTATLSMYVFDDYREASICSAKDTRGAPPSNIWKQDQTEKFQAAVLVFDKRWKFPDTGLLEAVEVCVSKPGGILIAVWEEVSRSQKQYRQLWNYTIDVTEVGCPAPKITIPPENQFQGHKDLYFGWASTSNTSIIMFREYDGLPATKDYVFTNISDGNGLIYIGENASNAFDKTGNVSRDYGIRFYVGPGAPPNITGLPKSVEIDVDDYKGGDVVASLTYHDENTLQHLEMTYCFYPTNYNIFGVTEYERGRVNITVKKDSLHGFEGRTYEFTFNVTDTCLKASKIMIMNIVAATTSTTTTTTTKPTTTTTKPTNTTTKPTTTTTKPTTTTTKPTTTTTKPTTTIPATIPITTLSPELYTRSTAAIGSCISKTVVGAVGFMVALCHTFA